MCVYVYIYIIIYTYLRTFWELPELVSSSALLHPTAHDERRLQVDFESADAVSGPSVGRKPLSNPLPRILEIPPRPLVDSI